MYGKDQWSGREVEGRYSDIMTYFIRDLVPTGTEVDVSGINVKDLLTYPHYYFTNEYTAELDDELIHKIRQILDRTDCAVTIEATTDTLKNIPHDLINRCHVIYRIQDENLCKLKQTDTLSIDNGWYNCLQITKHNMSETTPDSYKFDIG